MAFDSKYEVICKHVVRRLFHLNTLVEKLNGKNTLALAA